MVIRIDGKLLSLLPKSLKEFFNSNSGINLAAAKFLKETVKVVESKYSLYVGQGEYAVIPSEDKHIKIIGSDEATTCHIIILKHPSGTVGVAHFDGSKKEKKIFQEIIQEFINIECNVTSIEAYVVGGYELCNEDLGKNASESLSMSILQMFHEHNCTIDLVIWCTCELNTNFVNGHPYPIFYGLAINREESIVFPALFTDQIPNYILRSASHWVDPYRISNNLYNYHKKYVSIFPFYNWNSDYFKSYSQFTDEDILKYFSTSPKVEPPTFCNKLRKVFLLLGNNNTESLFPNLLPKIYVMNINGDWEELLP